MNPIRIPTSSLTVTRLLWSVVVTRYVLNNLVSHLYDGHQDTIREGLTQIGYDAQSGRYTFRDDAGKVYRGAPGDEYGYSISDNDGFKPVINRPVFDTGEHCLFSAHIPVKG